MAGLIQKVLADDIVGKISNPLSGSYGEFNTGDGGGIIGLFTNILRLIFVGAGFFAFINIIVAGFGYMNAAGDSKKLSAAWSRIWQTLLGLVLLVGSFALAALIGQLFFNDPGFILNPKIYGP